MNKILCPSMMCCDFADLKREMQELEKANVDIYHCDIMDGIFVENMALAISDIKAIRKLTNKEIDAHLMIENPLHKVDWFIDAGVDIVYIHPESERYTSKTLKHIKKRGKKAGIVINPDTSISQVEEMLKICDMVLVMTVDPGFVGQGFVETTLEKIKKIVEGKKYNNYKIIIDGACSPYIISQLSRLGVDGFVLGTSALFGKEESYKSLIDNLREC